MSTATARAPALVILAGGASTRLGACKALVPLTPRNALELLSDHGSVMDGAPPLVIAGAHHAEIRAALPAGLELAFNADWEGGAITSVRLALDLRPGFDLCLAPVDVPLVPRAVFELMLEHWRASGSLEQGWLAPCCRMEGMDRRDATAVAYGHPVIVGRELARALRTLDARATLRDLRARANRLLSVEVPHREVLDDLDTPDDLLRLKARSPD